MSVRANNILTNFDRMKRTALSSILVAFGMTMMAQYYHGPRLGLGLATQSVGGLFQNTGDLLPAPVFGWGLDFPLHPQFSIMPELLWLTKGAVVRNPAEDTHSRTVFRYLELPIMVKIGTDAQPGGILITAGPSIGYFVSGHYKSWLGGDLIDDVDYDLSESDNRWDFSGAVGIGFDQKKWTFEMRAQSSLTPFSSVTEVHNIVYQFVFAWRFEVKPKDAAEEEVE